MLEALEARWAKADQDVFIAALILNPFHKTSAFNPLSCLAPGSVFALMRCLWHCFYRNEDGTPQEPPTELFTKVLSYLNSSGDFREMEDVILHIRTRAEMAVCTTLSYYLAFTYLCLG